MKKLGPKGASILKKSLLAFGALIVLSVIFGNHSTTTLNSASNKPQSGTHSQLNASDGHHAKAAPKITTSLVTETKDIPFTTTTVNDGSLPKGTTKVTTQGAAGISTLTYKITYSNGTQTNKELVSSVVTKQPVTQVMHVGTFVAPPQPSCTNGTYVNSSGNTVCSPETSSSTPAGATAQCEDGSYSFSQHRSGTCSHHGGVAEWL